MNNHSTLKLQKENNIEEISKYVLASIHLIFQVEVK